MNTFCSSTGPTMMRLALALTSVAAATSLAYGQVGMETAIVARAGRAGRTHRAAGERAPPARNQCRCKWRWPRR